MKALKIAIATIVLGLSVQAASAQVSIGVSIGTPAPRRVVVVDRPVYYERPVVYHPRRTVVVERYAAPRYRQVYYRGGHRYYSPRTVVYRDVHHRPLPPRHGHGRW